MTFETEAVSTPGGQERKVSDLVAGTTKAVKEAYGQMKDMSPAMLKTGLETVEARVPGEWSEKISKASEPVLTALDKTVAGVNQKVTTMVIEPVNKTVADVREGVNTKVGQVTTGLKDLRGDLKKKANERLEEVREFSATKGKDMIHVDLIEYSRDILDNGVKYSKGVVSNARATLDPVLVLVTEKLVKDVETAVTDLRKVVADRSSQTQEEIAAVREQVLTKLAAAKVAARDLGAQGVELVKAKYNELPQKEALEAMVSARLPAYLHPHIQVILAAPRVFAARAEEVRAKADLDSDRRVLDNIASLLKAVREVMFAPITPEGQVAA